MVFGLFEYLVIYCVFHILFSNTSMVEVSLRRAQTAFAAFGQGLPLINSDRGSFSSAAGKQVKPMHVWRVEALKLHLHIVKHIIALYYGSCFYM